MQNLCALPRQALPRQAKETGISAPINNKAGALFKVRTILCHLGALLNTGGKSLICNCSGYGTAISAGCCMKVGGIFSVLFSLGEKGLR